MTTYREVEKEKQNLARCESKLAMEKLKKRKSETRFKIELGGLVIKSGMSQYEKSVILGGLIYAASAIKHNLNNERLFELSGNELFAQNTASQEQ